MRIKMEWRLEKVTQSKMINQNKDKHLKHRLDLSKERQQI